MNDLRFQRWAKSGRSGTAAKELGVFVGVVVGKGVVYPSLLSEGDIKVTFQSVGSASMSYLK